MFPRNFEAISNISNIPQYCDCSQSFKQQFHKHCKCQKYGLQTSCEYDGVSPWANLGKLNSMSEAMEHTFSECLEHGEARIIHFAQK